MVLRAGADSSSALRSFAGSHVDQHFNFRLCDRFDHTRLVRKLTKS